MTRVLVDPQTLKALGGLGSPLVFCDADGQTLGFFQPAAARNPQILDLGISEEEIRRRQKIRTGRTLSEIFSDLESRK